MLGYAEASTCRRRLLLAYFGEESGDCGNCDTCLSPPELWDATGAAQKVLSAAVRTGQRFGAGHLIDVLAGRRTAKVESWAHHELPTFGVGSDLSDQEWRSVVRQLVARRVLVPDASRMGVLQLADGARPILDGTERVELRRFVKPEKARPPKRSRSASGDGLGVGAGPGRSFEVLRAERKRIADAEERPGVRRAAGPHPLGAGCRPPPTTDELLAVNGIGPVKAERYGERFLALLGDAAPPTP